MCRALTVFCLRLRFANPVSFFFFSVFFYSLPSCAFMPSLLSCWLLSCSTPDRRYRFFFFSLLFRLFPSPSLVIPFLQHTIPPLLLFFSSFPPFFSVCCPSLVVAFLQHTIPPLSLATCLFTERLEDFATCGAQLSGGGGQVAVLWGESSVQCIVCIPKRGTVRDSACICACVCLCKVVVKW